MATQVNGSLRLRRRADPRIERLTRSPVLRDLAPNELQRLLPHVSEVAVPAGTVILDSNSALLDLYLVTSGIAMSVEQGGRLELYGPGEPVALAQLIAGESRSACLIVACVDTDLVVVNKRHFAALAPVVPALAYAVLRQHCKHEMASEPIS